MLHQQPGWIHESSSWAHLPASDCARTGRQTCLRISAELPMLLEIDSYSDLSTVEQGQTVNVYSVKGGIVRVCEDIPTWTISCYTHSTPLSQFRSRVASLSHRGQRERQRARENLPVAAAASCHSLKRRRRTCWVADDSEQEEQGALCYRVQLMVAVGS